MEAIGKHPAGNFSWIELMSSDQQLSKAFYTQLLGLTAVDMPIGGDDVYTLLKIDGLDVAAIGQLTPDMLATGTPVAWNSYIEVANADETAVKAVELGGTVLAAPFDVMDSGRMAVLQDPSGGVISVWQANNHLGFQVRDVPGAFCWNELMTPAPDKAIPFYERLFGWEKAEAWPEENYQVMKNNGRELAGVALQEGSPYWNLCFAVADAAATSDKVAALGGELVTPPAFAEGIGYYAVIRDPHGAIFSILQPE